MTWRESITKEEIKDLPKEIFMGKIVVVEDDKAVHDAIVALRNEKIVGFDTETRPSFKKGVSNKVSLLQLSSEEVCYLFRLNKIGINKEILQFLEDKNCKKIGLSVHDDLHSLNRVCLVKESGFEDLQQVVKKYGIKDLSLQKIYAIIFGKRISKTQRLSNWEATELTEAQMRYAATDAWATLKIYQQITQS